MTSVLVAIGCFALAGCASGHKTGAEGTVVTSPRSIVDVRSAPVTLIVSGTATIPDVKPGTSVACKGGAPKVKVPADLRAAAGKSYTVGVSESGGWSDPGPGHPAHTPSLQLSRSPDGTVTVTCTRR